jgi:NhaP-type Na+/H+ or K+/H+ antiporter
MPQSKGIWRKIVVLGVVGGLAFWAITIAISLLPIAAEYRAAESISNIQTVWVGGLLVGLIIGCFVSYFLLRFFDKIPTKNPILKSLILSFVAIVVIEVLSTFGNPSNAYVFLLVDTVMNIPRILALGLVVGYLYKRLYGQA